MTEEISSVTEEDDNKTEETQGEESQPLCFQCLTPVEPLQHYCSNCGGTVGNYTRYLPFVNIPFQVEFSAKVWMKFWRSDDSLLLRILIFPIVIFMWGPIFLIGLPFELWRKYKKGNA
jgi:hypothetical protein